MKAYENETTEVDLTLKPKLNFKNILSGNGDKVKNIEFKVRIDHTFDERTSMHLQIEGDILNANKTGNPGITKAKIEFGVRI